MMNVLRSSCEVLVILVKRFFINIQISNFTKIRPMGAGRTDALTDGSIDRHEESNSRFRNFVKSSKIGKQ